MPKKILDHASLVIMANFLIFNLENVNNVKIFICLIFIQKDVLKLIVKLIKFLIKQLNNVKIVQSNSLFIILLPLNVRNVLFILHLMSNKKNVLDINVE